MGGGGAMRAAAKVAGIGALRGVPAMSPAEHQVSDAARKATRPVSAIVSASEEMKSGVLAASENSVVEAAVQRPCWELDDWEFAGHEEEPIVKFAEPIPRVVFDVAPTLQEAKEATAELKDALDKVYLSSPNSAKCGDSFVSGYESALSEYQETKACVTSETAAASVPRNALQAFRLLNESPAAQNVVASIASDPNVWQAVLHNEALVEYLQSQRSTASFSDVHAVVQESIANAESLDKSPKPVDSSVDSGQSADSGNGFMGFVQSIKITVVDMMSNLSDYFQSIFGGPTEEKVCGDSDGNANSPFMEKALGASFMGLAVMVIVVMVLKRG